MKKDLTEFTTVVGAETASAAVCVKNKITVSAKKFLPAIHHLTSGMELNLIRFILRCTQADSNKR